MSDLQVGVPAAGAAPAAERLTPGRAVEEAAVFITAAVLLQDVPHLRLEERHVHVDRHHLQPDGPDRTSPTGQTHSKTFKHQSINTKTSPVI